MEERDEPGRIRPLPPDLPDVAVTGDPLPTPRDRRWVPLAVAGGALVFFGLIAGVLSGPGDDNANRGTASAATTTIAAIGGPARATTTATPVPPRLTEWAPPLQRDVTIVYVEPNGLVTSEVTWALGDDAPGPPRSSGASARSASFDSSREQLTWITAGDRAQTLWVGRPPDAEPAFVDVTSAAWHASAPSALGWIGTPLGGSRPHLFATYTSPLAEVGAVLDLGAVPAATQLIAWGDWGFLLHVPAPLEYRRWSVEDAAGGGPQSLLLEFALVLDGAGTPTAAYPAAPRAAGALGHVIVQPATVAYDLAIGAGLDIDSLGFGVDITTLRRGPNGEPMVMLLPDGTMSDVTFEPRSPATTFAFTPAGTHVSAMGRVADRYAIQTVAVDGSSQRITSLQDVDTYVGHTREGSLLVLHNSASGALVFHDWNRGASYRVPFAGGRVLAVDA